MNKTSLTTALVFFALGTWPYAATADTESVLDALADCVKIRNSAERLRCFESIASKSQPQIFAKKNHGKVNKAEVAFLKATELTDDTQQDENAMQRQRVDLNKFAPLASKNTQSNSIRAIISSLSKSRRDRWRISLESGQVWMQTDNRQVDLAVGQDVILQKGSFSSFFLKLPDLNARFRVRRIK